MQNFGIQLYSVRDTTEKDMARTLKALSEMGYTSVEFAGFFQYKPEEITAMLSDSNLSVSGTHTGLNDILADLNGVIAYHKAIGNHYMIIPGYDLSDADKLDHFVTAVNALKPCLSAEGITLGYHNHSGEFKDGLYEAIVSRTDLMLELDTFWAFVGGRDPVAMMEELKERIGFIHIKDGTKAGKGHPLGHGKAPVHAVYKKALAMNIPMIVESETLNPDGLTEARRCIEWLKAQQ